MKIKFIWYDFLMGVLSKLVWKFKYARCIAKQSETEFSWGWYLAGIAIEGDEAWRKEDSIDSAFTEMSYWTED